MSEWINVRDRLPNEDTVQPLVGGLGDGPPYCMDCCGFGYKRKNLTHFPFTEFKYCSTCARTGRAKDHPANAPLERLREKEIE